MPPVGMAWKAPSKRFVLHQFFTIILRLSSLVSFLLILSSRSAFLLPLYAFCRVRVCIRTSMGAALAEQQRLRRQPWYTHCIQLTLHTQSTSTHTDTHFQKSCADRSRPPPLTPSTQTVWAPLHTLRGWRYSLQVSSWSRYASPRHSGSTKRGW